MNLISLEKNLQKSSYKKIEKDNEHMEWLK